MKISPLFKKLNLKDQGTIFVIDAPATCRAELARLEGVDIEPTLARATGGVTFLLAFVTRTPQIEAVASKLTRIAPGDPVIWFAYPKLSSKRYKSEISRDTGWAALGAAGFEGVRMVAIDADWSAARFRRAEFIKTMKRDSAHAMSRAGKARTARK